MGPQLRIDFPPTIPRQLLQCHQHSTPSQPPPHSVAARQMAGMGRSRNFPCSIISVVTFSPGQDEHGALAALPRLGTPVTRVSKS